MEPYTPAGNVRAAKKQRLFFFYSSVKFFTAEKMNPGPLTHQNNDGWLMTSHKKRQRPIPRQTWRQLKEQFVILN